LIFISRNSLYGTTNNPYDLTRIVGGSSGGAGCIISAAGVPIAVGADVGGSIRLPSFMNGIFGHKPTPSIEKRNYFITEKNENLYLIFE
jgi:fatty acid amide hydrolase 2